MSQQRSNAAKRVRREAGTAILGCLDADLKTADSRLKKFKELVGWVEENGKGYYEEFAPILYEEGNGPGVERIFKSPYLINVCLLCSPFSIQCSLMYLRPGKPLS
jgi:hypothetical protein